jgi:tRNA (cytosine38-C5)-methyltransferase
MGITAAMLDRFQADVFMMSPPCQRQGNQLGSADSRADSFFHLIDQLAYMAHAPTYLFVENVKGFDTSDTRQWLRKQLLQLGYFIR